MSLAATCGWTLARTIVLCLLAWPVCRVIERALNQVTSRWRGPALAALLLPCCFPELLVGYAFRDLAMARPNWAELMCSVLLLIRVIPIGAIALLAAPPSAVDAAAIHCRRSLVGSRRTWPQRWELVRCWWHGPIRRALPALALMSIVAFQEFEMAALLQTMSWTDWFVTAQRLGLERNQMLWQSLLPLAGQAPVLLGVLWWMNSRRIAALPGAQTQDESVSRNFVWLGAGFIGVIVVLGCLVPLGLIGWRTVDGIALLLRQRVQQIGLLREMSTSAAIAVCAGMTAWAISGRLTWPAANLLVLGLFGSLLLSLGCVALFQLPGLRPMYDTPVPWVFALILWLLPRAAILRLWLAALRGDEAIHTVRLLGAEPSTARSGRVSSLLWHLRDQPQFLAIGLLCYWAYCDLPTAYMLAPTGMASGLVRLYNFMHFGRSAALSAEASVFFGVPVAGVFLALSMIRLIRKRG